MNTILIFAWIWAAMIAMSVWEASGEGRRTFGKGKFGWKIYFGKYLVTSSYHFFIFFVMLPLLLALPLVIYGWNLALFGILLSAYYSGQIIEDFMWYVVNPVVKFREWRTKFSDYYPWLKIGKVKIIPWCYLQNLAIALLSWYLFWR